MKKLTKIQSILLKAAKEAGKVHLEYFRQNNYRVQEKKNRHDVLTVADTKSQKVVEKTLRDEMIKAGYAKADIGFVGEENLFKPSEYTFVIDPIDGTSNFVHGIDYFCVSIAVLKNKKPLAGCIYQVTTDTVYVAEVGKGARKIKGRTSTPLHIDHTPLSDGIFATCFSYHSGESRNRVKLVEAMRTKVHNMRVFGSAALDLCYLADNQIDLIAAGAYVWDYAAAYIIARESGAIMTDWQGNPFEINISTHKRRHQVVACHPDNLKSLLKIVQPILVG